MAHEDVIGHGSPDDEHLETPPGSTYEHTDANVGIIVRFVVWLAVSAVVIHVGLGFLYQVFIDGSMITDRRIHLRWGRRSAAGAAPAAVSAKRDLSVPHRRKRAARALRLDEP